MMPESPDKHSSGSGSMLLGFRAENARSFREQVELSLPATRVADAEVVREISWRRNGKSLGVLPATGIFGANGSGKSNLLCVMNDMRAFVLSSFRLGTPRSRLPTWPFRLGKDRGEAPSTYEVDLVIDGIRHRYGFRLDATRILEEWAHWWPRGRSALLFRRQGDDIELPSGQRAGARAALGILRPNALFLSTAAAASHQTLLPLFEWFQRNLLFADVNSRTARQALTAELLEQADYRDQVLALLREADLGITGASKREMDAEMRERILRALSILRGEEEGSGSGEEDIEFEDFEVRMLHEAGGEEVELHPSEESRGTMVWFGMIGPVIEALHDGSVLLADELEASLHPHLVNVLVGLFQGKQSNPNRAQLIFNSHDVTLMGDSTSHALGRDQIWFTEKGKDGGTRLYPLTDLDPRKGEAIERRYLAGRYGATPIVSRRQLESIVEPAAAGDDR
jgi:uncharacterized protein